jgi:hypothetical protein
MSYFPDLSPYSYGHGAHPGVVHVGWLDDQHRYAKGEVDAALIQKLKWLAAHPVELYRGMHVCELCVGQPDIVKPGDDRRAINPEWSRWAAERSSNGEIRVTRGGITFAAPVLIVHYIEGHGYLPPQAFLKAVEETQVP